jgi:hypothetical protein
LGKVVIRWELHRFAIRKVLSAKDLSNRDFAIATTREDSQQTVAGWLVENCSIAVTAAALRYAMRPNNTSILADEVKGFGVNDPMDRYANKGGRNSSSAAAD